jgi:uroporphyrinogen decarboxylase
MLTPRERVFRALAFEETDFVPYHIMHDEALIPQFLPFLIDGSLSAGFINHLPFLNIDALKITAGPDSYYDEFGAFWKTCNNVPHLIAPPLTAPSMQGFELPAFTVEKYLPCIETFFRDHKDQFVMCGMALGFFDRCWALRGFENFMVDFIEHPGFVHALFEVLTDYYLNIIDAIRGYPFDGIRFADDWGAQRGLLMGPKTWRTFVKPGLKKIFAKARDSGLVVMVHSDGDIFDIIPDLIEIGVQILNPIQPEAMDVLEIKRRFGRSLCLNGGISSQYTLPWGTPFDVASETCACLRYLGQAGGYIIGPAKCILPDTPPQNSAALFGAILNQAVRPLSSGEPLPAHAPALARVYSAFHASGGQN